MHPLTTAHRDGYTRNVTFGDAALCTSMLGQYRLPGRDVNDGKSP